MKYFLMIDQDYTFVILAVLGIMFGVPIVLAILGLSYRKRNPKTAKVFYIIAGVYMLISLGICGTMMF